MRVQLAQQVQAILGPSDLVIITERVDDVALLIGQMVKMGFVEVLDRHLPRHEKQRGISWEWTAVLWLASILTAGDHRKVAVETSIKGMQTTRSHLSAQVIDPLDVRGCLKSPAMSVFGRCRAPLKVASIALSPLKSIMPNFTGTPFHAAMGTFQTASKDGIHPRSYERGPLPWFDRE